MLVGQGRKLQEGTKVVCRKNDSLYLLIWRRLAFILFTSLPVLFAYPNLSTFPPRSLTKEMKSQELTSGD